MHTGGRLGAGMHAAHDLAQNPSQPEQRLVEHYEVQVGMNPTVTHIEPALEFHLN